MMDGKDERPLLKDLLKQHATKIEELRAIIEKEDSYCENYDDIWILRFILSHKKVSKASVAAIKTMKFRQEKKLNELGDIRSRILDHRDHGSDRHMDVYKKYLRYCKDTTSLMYAQPDPDRGVFHIITPSQIDMHGIVEEMTLDEVLDTYTIGSEIMYQILDDVTRRTGRLTKTCRILDCTDFGLSSFNWEYIKRDATAGKQLEAYYPQLLGKMIIVNMGSWTTKFWRVVARMLPKGIVEKVSSVQTGKNTNDTKHFLKYVNEDNLWVRFGGMNKEWPVKPPTHLWENLPPQGKQH
jgi:hypothetical protein